MGSKPSLVASWEMLGLEETGREENIMKVERGPASSLDELARSPMGRKVGKRSRFVVEKLPSRDGGSFDVVSEDGAESVCPGLSPVGCWGSPIPNGLARTSWGREASKEPLSDVMSMGGRGIPAAPLGPERGPSEKSWSVFPTLRRGTPNFDISFELAGGRGAGFIIGWERWLGRNGPSRDPGRRSFGAPPKF